MYQRERFIIIGLCITSLLVVFLFSSTRSYAAVGRAAPADITITPKMPTVSDPVQIVVGGLWPDACVPQYAAHEIRQTMILITATLPLTDLVCGQVETPWSMTVALAPLPVDTYQIKVNGAVSISSTVNIASNLIYLPAIHHE